MSIEVVGAGAVIDVSVSKPSKSTSGAKTVEVTCGDVKAGVVGVD